MNQIRLTQYVATIALHSRTETIAHRSKTYTFGRPPFALAILLLSSSCSGESSSNAPTPIRLFAFPNEVEPLGQVTLAVDVQDCTSCTVCVRLGASKDSGLLLSPPGVPIDVELGTLRVPADAEATLTSLGYQAPNRETSQVVTASLLRGDTSCVNPDGFVIDTTTERIVVRLPPEAEIQPVASSADSGATHAMSSDAGEPAPAPQLETDAGANP